MATTSNFKTYERGSRYQTTQTMFTAGMYYADTPIPEGAAKVLVNYDVSMDGISIKPRRGLQTKKIACAGADTDYVASKTEAVASKVCFQNDKEFVQIITRTLSETDLGYRIGVLTIDQSSYQTKGALPVTKYKNTMTYKSDNEDTHKFVQGVFSKLNTPYTIHNMPCDTPAQHVGCFVNDQYFFFNAHTNKLVYTQFNPELEKYEMHELEPQDTTQSQAQQMGFNMLLDNPYNYSDVLVTGAATDTISFNAINAFEDSSCTTPAQQELVLNQKYYYRVAYTGCGTVKLVFDWTPAEQINWQELSTTSFTMSEADGALSKIVIPFSSPVEKAIIRCTAFRGEDPIDIIWFSFEYKQHLTKATKDIVNFTLATGTSMTYWKNRLVIAGVQEDKSYLFMSAPELFEYFPFPNNADYLDEPIIAVQAFLEDLLVFTKSKLYLYTLDAMTGLTRKCIQTNLNIKEEEAHLIKIVKNMAYFKSGNYYYMVVPKLNSTTGELTIAPVYRYVKEFFDKFEESMYDVLNDSYGIAERYPLQSVYNYLDYESVHNVYMLRIKEGLYINFDLLYNTVKRFWSIYVYESPAPIQMYKQDVTKVGEMYCVSVEESTAPIDTTDSLRKVYAPLLQLIEWDTGCEDKQLPQIVLKENVATAVPVHSTHNNKQYLDTGAIDINSNYKKRFREIQFRVHNTSKEDLNFATTFFIDGDARSPEFIYTPVVDNASGTLTLSKTFMSANPITADIKGRAKLGSWQLSKDTFPGADLIKVRMPVSGKGYNSQIKINCDTQKDYTLLDISNVYRQLYSR